MIDVLKRIKELRESRQWSEYELAKRAGICQSTLSSLYRNQNLPTLTTLESICSAFDMPLGQFFSPAMDKPDLTKWQKEWLAQYDVMGQEERESVCNMIDAFVATRCRI